MHRPITDSILLHVRAALTGAEHPRVLFLTGDAGAGKSAIVREACAAVQVMHAAPVVARAECSTPIAGGTVGEVESLKPFAVMMAQILESRLQHVLPDVAPSWSALLPADHVLHSSDHGSLSTSTAGAADQKQVLQQFLTFLRTVSHEQPLLLILEDAHWADDSSVELLASIADELRDEAVALVVVYRQDDAAQSHEGAGHKIADVHHRLLGSGRASSVHVASMSRGEVRELLRERFDQYQSNEGTEFQLLRLSGGNMLLLMQLLDTLVADGHMDAHTGAPLSDLSAVQIPSTTVSIVTDRLELLDPEDQELLRAASVEGLTFTARTVARLTGRSMLKVLQRLRSLEQQHALIKDAGKLTLVREPSQAWQFTHAVMQRSLYDQLTDAERESLHASMISILEGELDEARSARVNVHAVAVRLSIHAGLLSRYELAARTLLEGAQFLWECWSAEEALRLIGLCLYAIRRERSQHPGVLHDVEVQALLLRGRIANHQGRYAVALHTFESALPVAQRLGAGEAIADTLHGIGSILWVVGDFTRVLDVGHQALDISLSSGYTLGETRARNLIGNVYYRTAEFDEARKHYTEALAVARLHGHRIEEARILGNLGTAGYRLKEFDAALALLQESYDLYDRLGHSTDAARIHQNIGVIKARGGDLHGAIAIMTHALRDVRTYGSVLEESRVLIELASAYDRLGQFDEAVRLSEQAVDLKRQLKDVTGLVNAYGVHALALASMGRLTDSVTVYEHAIETATQHGLSYELLQLRLGYVDVLEDLERFDDAFAVYQIIVDTHRAAIPLQSYVQVLLECVGMLTKSTKLPAAEVRSQVETYRQRLRETLADPAIADDARTAFLTSWKQITNTELMSH
jgi:tetratricopeptide (TPR) repeat protein